MGATADLTDMPSTDKKTRTASAKDIEKSLAKRVREDSKTYQKPTVGFAHDIAPEMSDEDFQTILDEMLAKDKYADIRPVRAATKRDYLFCNLYLTHDQAMRLALIEDFKTDLLGRIRERSKQGQLVRLSSISSDGPSLTGSEIEAGLASMLADAGSTDVRQVTVFSGAVFLYSASHMAEESAASLARHDELRTKAHTRIREDSQYSSKLTSLASLKTIAPDLKAGEIEGVLEEIGQSNPEIRPISGREGEAYFFCNRHMTENYARTLVRAEANDPCYTILETVREESRVYPRPTNVELFKYGMFNIDRDRLDEYVKRVLDENEDIGGYRSSTGNVYLYCTTYLPDARAALIVERKEHPE